MRTVALSVLVVLLLVGIVVGISSCGVEIGYQPQDTTDSETFLISDRIQPGINRVIDKEAGVVCWVYKGLDRGGIDCLPISQTQLDP